MALLEPENLVVIGGEIITAVFFLAMLKFKTSAHEKQIEELEEKFEERRKEVDKEFKEVEQSFNRMRDRHDQVYNEIRAVTLGISKSISRLEGTLSIRSKDD